MRITSVRAVQPRTAADPPDWRTIVGQILVVVDTDTGVRGLGVGGGGAAGIHLVEQFLQPLLLGEDAHEVETRWQRMYQETMHFGRKGLAIMAISGVDLALWDARGKVEGKSVAALLSDTPHADVPAYASLPARPGILPSAAACVADGYRSVKLHTGRVSVEEAVERVTRTRAEIGPDIELLTDVIGGRWNLDESLRAAEGFVTSDVGWMEEPLPADELAGYAELNRRSPVPIAGGEHEYTVHGFREVAERHALSVWQPDACWVGGMTQMRAIYALAAEHGVRVCPHRGGEVWGLHAIAALDPNPLAESGRPWITWLRGQPPIVNGRIAVPNRPGFGVDVASDLLGF